MSFIHMNTRKIWFISLANALGVFLYTSAVAWVLFHVEQLFGRVRSFWAPAALLMLFVFSATVVGLMVLGRPAYLYLNGFRRQALQLLFYTVGWLLLLTAVVFVGLALRL